MKRNTFILRYGAFAVVATIANLAAQRLIIKIVSAEFSFALAVFVGTAVGLVLKYLLDKRWIFFDMTRGVAMHRKKFTLYTLMGAATTLIFWGTETTFWLVWQTNFMRETGAILGLIIGYTIKYNLDRRYVFHTTAPPTI